MKPEMICRAGAFCQEKHPFWGIVKSSISLVNPNIFRLNDSIYFRSVGNG